MGMLFVPATSTAQSIRTRPYMYMARSTRTTSRLVNTITNLQHTHDVTAMKFTRHIRQFLLVAHARRHGYEYYTAHRRQFLRHAMKFKFTHRFHTLFFLNPPNGNDVVKKQELSYMLICTQLRWVFLSN